MKSITPGESGFNAIIVEGVDFPEKKKYKCKIKIGVANGNSFEHCVTKYKTYSDVGEGDVPPPVYKRYVEAGKVSGYTDLMAKLQTKNIEEVIGALGISAIMGL